MEINHIENSGKGCFEPMINGKKVGSISYINIGNDMFIIDRTDIRPEFSGRDIGKNMMQEVAKYARKNHKKIMPLCPFAKSISEKMPEIYDLIE